MRQWCGGFPLRGAWRGQSWSGARHWKQIFGVCPALCWLRPLAPLAREATEPTREEEAAREKEAARAGETTWVLRMQENTIL